MATFKNFDAWEKAFKKRMNKTVKTAVTDLARNIVRDTPVETSALKSSWNTSTGSPEFSFNPDKQDEGTSSLTDLESTTDSWDIYNQDLYFVTGADYAYDIEYLGWSHTKAPQGMVEINTLQWPNILKQQLNKNFT